MCLDVSRCKGGGGHFQAGQRRTCTLMTPLVVTMVYEMHPAVVHVEGSVTGASEPRVAVYPASGEVVDGA